MMIRTTHGRRAFMRRAALAGASVGLPPLLGGSLARAAPNAGSTLTLGLPGVTPTIDPLNMLNHDWMVVSQTIYENLIEFDSNGHLKPQLAIALPTISADGLTYDFTLRPNVTFQNGAPFSAEDVKYSFDWLLDPANKAVRRPIFTRIKEVVVIDPMHVRFILSQPYAPWLAFMTKCMGIFPKGSREAHGPDFFRSAPVGMGTGPGIFEAWQINDNISLKRNPHYWGKGVPAWERLVVRQLPAAEERVAYVRTGQADIIGEPPARQFAQLAKTRGLAGASRVTLGGWFAMYFDNTKPPFTDVNLRRAIACAIDRKTIADKVYYGLLDASGTIAPPDAWWYDPVADKEVAFDLEKAKQHLAKSQYAKGVTFELTIPSSTYLLNVRDAALVIQSQLAKVGITVKLKMMEFLPMLQGVIAGTVASSLWVQMSPGEPTYLVQNCLTPGQVIYNVSKYPNYLELDTFLNKAFAETDQAKLKPVYAAMARFLAQQSPIVWIGFVHAANVWRTQVHDFTVNQGLTIDPRPVTLS
ncbi:MAG TPA: ABC transporter substrate-binding protein [Acetobacteraceae bacterium]|nr:ABC transporter substrate-binding protein [Acetobacteraceae bacterium]